MEAMRQSWSDDRLDDLNKRVDSGFTRVDARFAQMEERMDARFARFEAKFDSKIDTAATELRQQMQADTHQLNSRFDAMQQTFIRVGGGLIGVLFASGAGLIVTQL